jgi:hypothetical protein
MQEGSAERSEVEGPGVVLPSSALLGSGGAGSGGTTSVREEYDHMTRQKARGEERVRAGSLFAVLLLLERGGYRG